MLLSTFGALAVCVARASAFKDTSPYLFFSSSDSSSTTSSRQLQSATEALKITKDFLSSCSSDLYVIVTQPNANAADYSSSGAVPHLRSAMSNENIKTRVSVSEIVGELDPQEIQDYITSKCDAVVEKFAMTADGFTLIDKPSRPLVVRIDFSSLPRTTSKRADKLADNDSLLQSILNSLPTTEYTLMYITTPVTDNIVHNTPSYEPVFMDSLHMEIKRQRTFAAAPSNDTIALQGQSLFDRYQFFTPGLFMGLLVTFLLLAILSVGVTALGSLQVSYGAFEKEMGPAAHKKQQ